MIGNLSPVKLNIIEHVFVREGGDVNKVLWEREKYWQVQLQTTLTHGLNNVNEYGVHLTDETIGNNC